MKQQEGETAEPEPDKSGFTPGDEPHEEGNLHDGTHDSSAFVGTIPDESVSPIKLVPRKRGDASATPSQTSRSPEDAADVNQCWVLVVTPHTPELCAFAWGFGGDLDFILTLVSVGELQEDEESGREFPDPVDGLPLPPMEKEGLMLDKIMLGGAPQAKARRRELWRKLRQRTRIAICQLHRQFGHPKPAGKAPFELQEAARVKTHFDFEFNSSVGIDCLEIRDHFGKK